MENRILFGVRFNNLGRDKLLENILDFIKSKKKGYLVTPNVDHIVKLKKDMEFKEVYDNADFVLADGKPIIFVSRLVGKPILEKVSGSDLFKPLLAMAEQKKIRVFFLGAKEETSKIAVEKMKTEFPNLKIAGRYSPPFGFENDEMENNKIEKLINDASPAMLFLFLGAPKQEKWIYKNIKKLEINLAFCFGATLDFYSGDIKRAPQWIQKMGFEWFWRMIMDPKRLVKRYLIEDMFPFLGITIKELLQLISIRKK
jgi:N-acetylglucosaminyldiphosphoundecaprenol N-acetyl-beta-D-mannosaminyltransferase